MLKCQKFQISIFLSALFFLSNTLDQSFLSIKDVMKTAKKRTLHVLHSWCEGKKQLSVSSRADVSRHRLDLSQISRC
jgi:hypothetical protein